MASGHQNKEYGRVGAYYCGNTIVLSKVGVAVMTTFNRHNPPIHLNSKILLQESYFREAKLCRHEVPSIMYVENIFINALLKVVFLKCTEIPF